MTAGVGEHKGADMAIVPAPGGSGAPALGEPLPVEFGNTRYAVRGTRGGVHDALDTPETLTAWIAEHEAEFPEGVASAALGGLRPGDLPRFVALRDAIRTVSRNAADGTEPDPAAIATINQAAGAAPRIPRLRLEPDGTLTAIKCADAHPLAALSTLAADAIMLFGSAERDLLRACGGPGCVLFYVQNHPRRGWCSAGCGNRARVARHHERHKG
ncbi:CGNR zinc finger domain-containing protein [Yinghuangia soli]|uniref:ABATE domain-containing protein n=1 Tax=Yinghuangia soli TaxID=2908204 RepID=A0AA41Q8B7_9ACTN|nr:CGNR zinc finger domain-containing protein [Yinghuangia soli]MCF2532581.1 ABATE domain-containing protein [Yinghuangia soli]